MFHFLISSAAKLFQALATLSALYSIFCFLIILAHLLFDEDFRLSALRNIKSFSHAIKHTIVHVDDTTSTGQIFPFFIASRTVLVIQLINGFAYYFDLYPAYLGDLSPGPVSFCLFAPGFLASLFFRFNIYWYKPRSLASHSEEYPMTTKPKDYTKLRGFLLVLTIFQFLGILLYLSDMGYIFYLKTVNPAVSSLAPFLLLYDLYAIILTFVGLHFLFERDRRFRFVFILGLISSLVIYIVQFIFVCISNSPDSLIRLLFNFTAFFLSRGVVLVYLYNSKRVAVYFSIPGPLLDAYNAQTAQQECLEEADKKLYPHGHPASDIPAPSSAASPIRSAPAPRPSVSAAPHTPAASTAAAQADSSSAVSAPTKASPSRVRPSLSAERRAFLKGIACTLLILALLVGGYFGVQAYRAYLRSIYDEGFIDGLKTGYNQGHSAGLSETSDDMQEQLDYRYRQGYKNGYNDCGNNWRYNSTPPF